jgi:prepilin-type processing-associated H-X9-DG protein
VKLLAVTDGLSNTAMFSETTRAWNSDPAPGHPSDPAWYKPDIVYVIAQSVWSDTTINATVCNNWDDDNNLDGIFYRGGEYYRDINAFCLYTHTVPPNYRGWDCTVSSFTPSAYPAAHIAARSYHPGGVNVCFGDGSVRFVRDQIATAVWALLGSRADGQPIDGSQL